MRLFLAVSVGEQFVDALTTELATWSPRVSLRWTRPETWHITLQFLDEWPESRVPGLIEGLEEVCALPTFDLTPGCLDGFPNLDSPRVLFLQMGDDGSCARLAGRVQEVVERIWPQGPQDRRQFRGHLTLGRCRKQLCSDEINLLKNKRLGPFDKVPVMGFQLVMSKLKRSGPQYSELAVFSLRKKGE